MAYEINFCETKEQLKHLGEVVTGKTDGSPTGADIDKSTLEYTGQVRATLPKLLERIGWYSVGEWSTDPLISNDNEYVLYNGIRYVPLSTPYQVNSTANPDPEALVGTELKVITDVTGSDLTQSQEELLPPGAQIFPAQGSLQNGDIVTVGATHLRVNIGGKPVIVAMSPIASGFVSNLAENSVTIGGSPVAFKPYNHADFIKTDDGRSVQEYLDDLAITSPPESAIIFIPFGQSNAARRAPRVSAAATPSNVFTFNGGSQKGDDSASQLNILFAVTEQDMSSLVPYNENGEDAEGTAPGFAAGTIGVAASRIYTWTGAIGSRHWRELKPGKAVWNSFCQGIRQLKKLAEADGYSSFKYVFYWDHGESEADNLAPGNSPTDVPVTKQQYIELLENVNKSIGTYLGYITNQANPDYTIMMAPIQTPGTTVNPSFTFRDVQDAQLQYSLVTANAFLVGGKSQLPSESDNVHTTGLGRRYLAEKTAQVYKRILGGMTWAPLHMSSASRAGNIVTVTCSVPLFGSLVIDTDTVSDTADFIAGSKYGFEYYDSTGKVSINDITVNSNVITITLDSTPSGTGELIRCAQIQPTTATTSPDFKPRTSLRSDTNKLTSSLDGTVIYDFMVPHSIGVS